MNVKTMGWTLIGASVLLAVSGVLMGLGWVVREYVPALWIGDKFSPMPLLLFYNGFVIVLMAGITLVPCYFVGRFVGMFWEGEK